MPTIPSDNGSSDPSNASASGKMDRTMELVFVSSGVFFWDYLPVLFLFSLLFASSITVSQYTCHSLGKIGGVAKALFLGGGGSRIFSCHPGVFVSRST